MTTFLFVAYYFPPIGGAGVQRALALTCYLPGDSLVPTVLTGPPTMTDRWGPSDESLSGSVPGRVPVHRVPPPVPAPSGRWRSRMERWLLLPKPFSSWWVPEVVALGERVATTERLVVATMSPFESGEAARRLAERLGFRGSLISVTPGRSTRCRSFRARFTAESSCVGWSGCYRARPRS